MDSQELVNGLSKLVGYGIVLPAFFVIIPQILKVFMLNLISKMVGIIVFRFIVFSYHYIGPQIEAKSDHYSYFECGGY